MCSFRLGPALLLAVLQTTACDTGLDGKSTTDSAGSSESTSTTAAVQTSDESSGGTMAASSNTTDAATTGTSSGTVGDQTDGSSESGSTGPTEVTPPDERLLHCGAGGGNVVMLDLAEGDTYEVVWEWHAEDAAGWEDPEGFSSVADCKVVEDGTQIALSGNHAVALVEFPSGDVLLHGPLPAAHSVALLPGGRLVGVGASSGLVRLFEVGRNDTVVWEDDMESAHGVVWDRGRELVYVIGHDRLRKYALVNWDTAEPALEELEELELPDRGAHDLSVVPGSDLLVLSTRWDVWTYDRSTDAFAPFEPIATWRKVKSVDIHPETGRVAVGQGEEDYWATQVQLRSPDAIIPLPESERLYKTRWFARETAAAL